MKIQARTKFDIGDTVQVKGTESRFLIGEIRTITCTAGTQVLYEGITLMKGFSYKNGGYEAEKIFAINEVMLEAVPKQEAKDGRFKV